jgi:hypothetical protein
MNLADAAPKPQRPAQAQPSAMATLPPDALLAQLGSEVASVLSAALDRVHSLVATGRIDKTNLRALCSEIDLARRVGIMGQQVVRLANGDVNLASERLDLPALLNEVLRQRRQDIDARGAEVRQEFAAAEVQTDATLLFSFLQGLLDWCFEHTVSRIDMVVRTSGWPARARLVTGFFYLPPDIADSHPVGNGGVGHGDEPESRHAHQLNTMSWRLLQQTAAVLGLEVTRLDHLGRSELHVAFPKTLTALVEERPGVDAEMPILHSLHAHPLSGQQVLVVTARRELHNVVREALRPMGMLIDFVSNAQEAADWCNTTLPDAVVHEEGLTDPAWQALRAALTQESRRIAFLSITEQGKAFEVLNAGERQVASVGRDAVLTALPAALLFELSRQG